MPLANCIPREKVKQGVASLESLGATSGVVSDMIRSSWGSFAEKALPMAPAGPNKVNLEKMIGMLKEGKDVN